MIDDFHGNNSWLSNFYECEVRFEGQSYPSVEAAYQAAKTLDAKLRAEVAAETSPALAKKRGRKLKIRPDWDDIKLAVMASCLFYKFTAHPELRAKLLGTGKEDLVEENWWGDRYWGTTKGVGENHLGRLLMELREKLRS